MEAYTWSSGAAPCRLQLLWQEEGAEGLKDEAKVVKSLWFSWMSSEGFKHGQAPCTLLLEAHGQAA